MPPRRQTSGIIGLPANLNLAHTGDVRPSQVLYELTSHLVLHKWRNADEAPQLQLFGQLKRIAKQWLDTYLHCKGGTYPAQLKYKVLANTAAEKIAAAITRHFKDERPITALLDPYNPSGSTRFVRFTTSKTERWETSAEKCHVNWVILDSDWEASSAASPSPIQKSAPTSKTTTSDWRFRITSAANRGATSRTSLSSWMTVTARTTSCTSSSKSKATAARMPSPRPRR